LSASRSVLRKYIARRFKQERLRGGRICIGF
jgi:hypothetical protein